MPELRKKPLVEAILELRWGPTLIPDQQPAPTDPHYNLLVGRLFDRVQSTYPFHEQLPAAQLPQDLVPQVAQHRFRVAENDWPLIQIGPGLFTLNEAAKYDWKRDFRNRAMAAVDYLFAAHPAARELRIQQLTLRYLDAIPFDPQQQGSALDFLGEKLKVRINLPDTLFQKYGVERAPAAVGTQLAFPSRKPKGVVAIKLGLGKAGGINAIIMDSSIESRGEDVPTLPTGFMPWIDDAHTIASEWFKELTRGELYDSFQPVRD